MDANMSREEAAMTKATSHEVAREPRQDAAGKGRCRWTTKARATVASTRGLRATPSSMPLALLLWSAPLLALACVGKVDSGTKDPRMGTAPGAAPGGTGGATASVPPAGTPTQTGTPSLPPPTGTSAPTAEAAGLMVLRRLTTREYNNTVADLLGDTTHPAAVFPADSPSNSGFIAPYEVGELHVQRYEEAAGNLADSALAANTLAVPCANPTAATEASCARQFIQQFGRKAFRRPVTTAESDGLAGLFTTARGLGFDFKQSLGQTVRAILQAPGFLYHWEAATPPSNVTNGVAPLTSHQIASRLSYFLWETMPDDVLSAAADADGLLAPDAVEAQARRMLMDARAKRSLENFHTHWLLIENLDNLQKSTAKFPFYLDATRDSLAPAMAEFTSSVLGAGGDGTLETLLTAPYAYVNAALAPIYGVTATGDALTRVDLTSSHRAGILTQATFLASRASVSASNPVYRGISVYRQLLCGAPRSVPNNVPPVEPDVVGKSTRDRYAGHASNPVCAACHAPTDPLGFAFENYDGVGAYRDVDGGKPVDATGKATTPLGATLTFNNAIELTRQLAQSDEVKWCVTKNWFRYLLGRPETDADKGSMELAFRAGSVTPGYSLRDVIATAVKSMAFRYRTVSAAASR